MRSMTTRAPVGSSRPAGDCVSGRANVSFDPGSTRDVVALGDDDSASDGAVVEGRPEGSEVLGQSRVVRVEPVGATRAMDCAGKSVRSPPPTPALPPRRWSAPWRTRSQGPSRTAVRAWLIKQMLSIAAIESVVWPRRPWTQEWGSCRRGNLFGWLAWQDLMIRRSMAIAGLGCMTSITPSSIRRPLLSSSPGWPEIAGCWSWR